MNFLVRYKIQSDSKLDQKLIDRVTKGLEKETEKVKKKFGGKLPNQVMREAAEKLLGIKDKNTSIFNINDKMEDLMKKHAGANPELAKILFELRRQKAELKRTFDHKASDRCDELRMEGIEILQKLLGKD